MKNTINWFAIEDQIRFGMSTSAKTRQNEPTQLAFYSRLTTTLEHAPQVEGKNMWILYANKQKQNNQLNITLDELPTKCHGVEG